MSGKSDQVKGRAKEAAGKLVGDKTLASGGKADRRAGQMKVTLHHTKDEVEAVIDKAGDKGEEAIEKIKRVLHPK